MSIAHSCFDCGKDCDCDGAPCECPCSERDLTDDDRDTARLTIAQRSCEQPLRYLKGLDADISDYVIADGDEVRVDWRAANQEAWLGNRRARLELLHAAIAHAPDVIKRKGWKHVDSFMVGLLVSGVLVQNMSINTERAVAMLVDADRGDD